jgi:hypothetical protein
VKNVCITIKYYGGLQIYLYSITHIFACLCG